MNKLIHLDNWKERVEWISLMELNAFQNYFKLSFEDSHLEYFERSFSIINNSRFLDLIGNDFPDNFLTLIDITHESNIKVSHTWVVKWVGKGLYKQYLLRVKENCLKETFKGIIEGAVENGKRRKIYWHHILKFFPLDLTTQHVYGCLSTSLCVLFSCKM